MVGDWRHRKSSGRPTTTTGKTGTLGVSQALKGSGLIATYALRVSGQLEHGLEVVPGLHITQTSADELLAKDLERFEKAVTD